VLEHISKFAPDRSGSRSTEGSFSRCRGTHRVLFTWLMHCLRSDSNSATAVAVSELTTCNGKDAEGARGEDGLRTRIPFRREETTPYSGVEKLGQKISGEQRQ
jgi:hypothetical protein